MKSTLILLLIFSIFCYKAESQKSILAIFAHPDDETTISPVLAEYATKSYEVNIIISTDGRYGITDHAKIPAGEPLVNVRQKEIECSCDAMGINPPILLNAQDGMKGLEGVDAQFGEFNYLVEEINKLIIKLRPDLIITMGPEGDSGHPDHRIVSAIVSQLYFSNSWSKTVDLFYCGWSEDQANKYEGWNLFHVSDDYLNTVISYSEASKQKHYDAIRCYVSQYSKDAMEDWISKDRNDKQNKLYFRRVVKSKDKRTSF